MQSTSAFTRGRRRLITALIALPLLSACALGQPTDELNLRYKFRGIGGASVVLDGVGEHEYFTITDDSGLNIANPSLLSRKVKRYLGYSGDDLPVPRSVHFVWRQGEVSYDSYVDPQGRYHPKQWRGGTVVGDYIVPVAERIPDEVLDELRANGGGLRLKFRVHDHGVMLGWDIERRPGYKLGATYDSKNPNIPVHFPAEHHLAGGDFREARIFNGKPVRMGWYIDANGQRVESDF